MIIERGFHDAERAQVAGLFWGAFGAKLGRVLGPDARAVAFVTDILDPSHCLTARSDDGALLGVVGFKTHESALVGGAWADMRRHYGLWGGAWRTAVLALLERDTDNERFLMDGIFVADGARGLGVGTALLDAICEEARARRFPAVRLDVIDSNPRARALYEREGFVAVGDQQMGPLKWIFGFAKATTMVRTVGA